MPCKAREGEQEEEGREGLHIGALRRTRGPVGGGVVDLEAQSLS
jgi:hypothetical protein